MAHRVGQVCPGLSQTRCMLSVDCLIWGQQGCATVFEACLSATHSNLYLSSKAPVAPELLPLGGGLHQHSWQHQMGEEWKLARTQRTAGIGPPWTCFRMRASLRANLTTAGRHVLPASMSYTGAASTPSLKVACALANLG